MQAEPSIQVSVIVPCRNEIRHIREFLESVFRQELSGIEMEVLIADGRSDDGTRLVLAELETRCAGLRVIDNPEKIASTGLNRAIRESRGEIILRMDAHTFYAPDYVRCCLEVLRKTNADNVGGPARTRAEGYIAQAIACAFHTPFACGGAKFHNPQYEGPVDTVPYGCWRKSTLERIGLFDEDQVRGQDDELNRRLVAHGGTIWQSPKIISWYRPRATLSTLFWQYFQYGFWKVAMIRKHRRCPTWRSIVPASTLLGGILLLLGAATATLGESARWRNTFLTGWLALAGVYLAASLVSSMAVALQKGWKFFPCMPIVFAAFQLSYALGFLLSVFYRPTIRGRVNPMHGVLTEITR